MVILPPSSSHMCPDQSCPHFPAAFKYQPPHQPGPICRAVVWIVLISFQVFECFCLTAAGADDLRLGW